MTFFLSKDIGEYRYSLCLFGHAKQNNILIGKFSDWGPSTVATEALTTTATTSTSSGLSSSSRYALQIYDKGALCMLGSASTVGQIQERPKRATQVTDLLHHFGHLVNVS